MRIAILLGLSLCLITRSIHADEHDQRLDLYFIDVEGGAATLIITPQGESLLIDSGYPDYGNRDRDRILHVLKDVAKRDHLDHALVTHWHLDHYGNHAALADKIKIGTFWDRGIPDTLMEDAKFEERVALYRAASQNQSKPLKAGDTLPLKSGSTPLAVKVITASGEVIPNDGPANPFADRHVAMEDDPSDNAKSISTLWSFGKFRFLCCGDLTWNTEAKLMTPNNPVGQVDLFMMTHHGLHVSNNPAMVLAIDPRVAIYCNGPTKGGSPQSLAVLKECQSLQAIYQLHRNVKLSDDEQTPAEFIANLAETADCKGVWAKASVAPDGNSYTVEIAGRPAKTYQVR
ncbi:MBL fold metallo-hydrolase [bacterium]|nr:MBL fold metallo-hydrolase [bacterium]